MIAVFAIGAFHSAAFANSFFIEQDGSNSRGEVRRHINISSPWSGGYLYEDFHVVGSVEVTESFTFYNLGPGADSRFNNGAGALSDARTEDNPASGAASNFGSGARVNTVIDVEGIIEPVAMSAPGWRDLFIMAG